VLDGLEPVEASIRVALGLDEPERGDPAPDHEHDDRREPEHPAPASPSRRGS
jgi:hypothetical protein